MNLLSWVLALTTLIILLIQAVDLHKATVCRQIAWLKSSELLTRATLSDVTPHERQWHLNCRLHVTRNQDEISWQRLPALNKNIFGIRPLGEL